MNDIQRTTSRAKLMNWLLSPTHDEGYTTPAELRPDVIFGLTMTDSRLDDELSVAVIKFSDTPDWLQRLNRDPCGFPKKKPFGTIWRAIDTTIQDEDGRTEFTRAIISSDLHYAEMMAEFEETNVNIQDKLGRTALHWACQKNLSVMVQLEQGLGVLGVLGVLGEIRSYSFCIRSRLSTRLFQLIIMHRNT